MDAIEKLAAMGKATDSHKKKARRNDTFAASVVARARAKKMTRKSPSTTGGARRTKKASPPSGGARRTPPPSGGSAKRRTKKPSPPPPPAIVTRVVSDVPCPLRVVVVDLGHERPVRALQVFDMPPPIPVGERDVDAAHRRVVDVDLAALLRERPTLTSRRSLSSPSTMLIGDFSLFAWLNAQTSCMRSSAG